MPIHPRRIYLRSLIVLLLVLAWATPTRPATARLTSDPMAIISAVNLLRAAQGLPPYVVDQGLMRYALEHSRYQASLHTATHQHSDGSTVWQHGMDENIAEGMLGYLTPEYAVYTIWSDALHMKTMVGYATGSVGAGVADDGEDEYYTLEVRPGSGVLPTTRPGDPNATPTKIIPIVPLLTVTPRADRWIIHTVGYGQSLWAVAIAYGVKMEQIRNWNSMAADATDIYAGQKLYIIAPAHIWPTLTASPVGGSGVPDTGQMVTPGWSITEEPKSATEKAAYQTAAAQTQLPLQEQSVSLGTAVSASQLMVSNPTASSTPNGRATASPAFAQGTIDTMAEVPDGDVRADTLPLLAGIFILFGGGLLLVYTFSMLRRR